MNTSQMLITLGALILLSLVILRVNRSFLTTDSVLLDSKIDVLAVSVATSMLEEANGKAFDENTDTTSISNVNLLSTTLGPESGETYPNFDDFDDFNGLTKIDSTNPIAKFYVTCEVNYVLPSNLDTKATNRTWHKKLTVYVTSPSMLGHDDKQDTLKMSTVFSYWYFR